MFSCSSENAGVINLVLYSPPKNGKTFTALSMSEAWPDELKPKPKEKIVLEDVAYLGYDSSGLLGLRQFGIYVKNSVNMGKVVRECRGDVAMATRRATEALMKLKGVQFVIHDTISKFDKMMMHRLDKVYASSKETMQKYGALLEEHRNYYFMHNETGLHNIYIFHEAKADLAKAKEDSTARAQREAKNASRVSADPRGLKKTVFPELTGNKAYNLYVGDTSDVLIPTKNLDTGKFEVHTRGTDTRIGGSKFEELLDPVEPANLRKIYQKAGVL